MSCLQFFFAGDLLSTLINWSSAILFVLLVRGAVGDVCCCRPPCVVATGTALNPRASTGLQNFVLPIMIYIIHVRKTSISGSGAAAKLLPGAGGGFSLNAAGAAATIIPAGAALGYASDAVFPTHVDDVASLAHGDEDEDARAKAAAAAAAEADAIQELPPGLRQCCTPMTGAWIIAAISVVLAIVTFALQIYGSETSN